MTVRAADQRPMRPGWSPSPGWRRQATIYPLNHVLRHYAWGSPTAIPELLGLPATAEPVAELWLGAHPDSPAVIDCAGTGRLLDQWIADNPGDALGEAVRSRFGDRLPYLLKVLAAEQALSLQVHPTTEQAERGFAAEEAAGVPHDARDRRYKDPFHKPELVVALTPFDALCGLRPVAETQRLLDELAIDHPVLARLRQLLDADDESACLRAAFEFLLASDEPLGGAVRACAEAAERYLRKAAAGPYADVAETTITLAATYPNDPGVLVSLLLNRLTLQPGEALYLPAGNVHAYLRGTGIEVMAASDNVLRAGLTPKYVDVAELLSVVDFHPRPSPYVRPEPASGASAAEVVRYRPDVAEFELGWVSLDGAEPIVVDPAGEPGPRIVFCLDGNAQVWAGETGPGTLVPGSSVFVPSSEPRLRLAGKGTVVVVSVPE